MKTMQQPTLDQNKNKNYQQSNPKCHSPTNYLGNELTMPFIHDKFLSLLFSFFFKQFFPFLFLLLSLIENKKIEKAFIICQLISPHIQHNPNERKHINIPSTYHYTKSTSIVPKTTPYEFEVTLYNLA